MTGGIWAVTAREEIARKSAHGFGRARPGSRGLQRFGGLGRVRHRHIFHRVLRTHWPGTLLASILLVSAREPNLVTFRVFFV